MNECPNFAAKVLINEDSTKKILFFLLLLSASTFDEVKGTDK